MFSQQNDPKIVFFDIETSPNVVYSWRVGYNIQLSPENIIEERKIICICYKYAGKKKVHKLAWKDGCDKKLLEEFGKVLNEADVAIGHNGDNFDIKWVKTRNMFHRLPPITNVVSIDTLKLIRTNFNLNSNKLGYATKFMGLPGKIKVEYSLWTRVLNGEKKALKEMLDYCAEDVVELELFFNEIRPYVDKMPVNLAILLNQDRESCPSCGHKHAIKYGIRTTRTGQHQKYQCKGCGHVFADSKKLKKRPLEYDRHIRKASS